MPPNLLTPAEAAQRFRDNGVPVTGRTVARWAKAGTIRSVTLPSGRLRIPVDAVDEYRAPEPTEQASA